MATPAPSDVPPATEAVVDENTKLSDLTDRQILELTQGIKDEQSHLRPLIGSAESIEELRKEYERGTPIFVQKIDWLRKHEWAQIRRSRGDGNCFYRAFGFSFCERILSNISASAAANTAIAKLESLLPVLDQAGFERAIYEDFFDPLKAILVSIADGALTADALLSAFNDPETSASVVVFLRLLTSAYIRANEADFAPFLLAFDEDWERFPKGAPDLHTFCQFYVEAVDRDADHLSITALTRCLNTSLKVAYIDASRTKEEDGLPSVDFISFDVDSADDAWDGTALCYRPGHYDLIYKVAV